MARKTSPENPLLPTWVHGLAVYGLSVDSQSRCAHYHSLQDVVALQFRCCRLFFACAACHAALADHEAACWPGTEMEIAQVLCGVCGTLHTAKAYLEAYRNGQPSCPACRTAWNPGCITHLNRYYEL